jgi:ribosomal protein S18 acetylase RimI-like enzyme
MRKTDGIVIRALAPEDEPILWIMLYLAIHVPPREPLPPLNSIFQPELARYVQGWGQPGDSGFVAFDTQNLPIGAAWLRLLTGEKRGYGWVDDQTPELSIAVVPEYRGMGLGTQLLSKAIHLAGEHFPAVSLSVSSGNPAASLYRRMGFVEVQKSSQSLTMVRKSPKKLWNRFFIRFARSGPRKKRYD